MSEVSRLPIHDAAPRFRKRRGIRDTQPVKAHFRVPVSGIGLTGLDTEKAMVPLFGGAVLAAFAEDRSGSGGGKVQQQVNPGDVETREWLDEPALALCLSEESPARHGWDQS